MKYRQGFVSNSSSCSFCIAKVHMTDEQVRKFDELINFLDDVEREGDDGMYDFAGHKFSKYVTEPIWYDEGGSPISVPHYFIGNIDKSIEGIIFNFLTDIGVKKEYICTYA